MSADAKAEEYMAQGNKALKKTSFFSFASGGQKYEDASDCFEKAGNQFKIAKKCTSWVREKRKRFCSYD
jgi:alpha-soluble NSF attachment protein